MLLFVVFVVIFGTCPSGALIFDFLFNGWLFVVPFEVGADTAADVIEAVLKSSILI